MAAATHAFEGREGLRRRRSLSLWTFGLLLVLLLSLQLGDGGAVCGAGKTAGLESAAVETRAVVVVALTDDFAAADDDAAVAVAEGGVGGLLEAEGQVVVSLHIEC